MANSREIDHIDAQLLRMFAVVSAITNPIIEEEKTQANCLSPEEKSELYTAFSELFQTKNKLKYKGELQISLFSKIFYDDVAINPNEFMTALCKFRNTYHRLKPTYPNESWKKLQVGMNILITTVTNIAMGACIGGLLAGVVLLTGGSAPLLALPLLKIGALMGIVRGLTEAEKISLGLFPKATSFNKLDTVIDETFANTKKSCFTPHPTN